MIGKTSATRITCSPKTIVAGSVDFASRLRISGSVPHSPAATATATTPTVAGRGLLSEEITQSSLEVSGDRLQVAHEFLQLRVPIVGSQDRRRMDGRDHYRRQVGLDRLPSALSDSELATEERLG